MNRILQILALLILAVLLWCAAPALTAIGQAPQPQQSQPPVIYAVPQPAPFPWVRYQVLGLGPRVEFYVPVGQPFAAQVQPVAPYSPRWWGGSR